MDTILKQAVENFINTLGYEVKECNDKNIKGYVGFIEIKGDKNIKFYVVIPTQKLELVSEVLLGSKHEYDLEDLTKEIANLIIGNSKVVAAKNNIHFEISLPKFMGEYNNDIDYDVFKCYEVDGIKFYILYKEE